MNPIWNTSEPVALVRVISMLCCDSAYFLSRCFVGDASDSDAPKTINTWKKPDSDSGLTHSTAERFAGSNCLCLCRYRRAVFIPKKNAKKYRAKPLTAWNDNKECSSSLGAGMASTKNKGSCMNWCKAQIVLRKTQGDFDSNAGCCQWNPECVGTTNCKQCQLYVGSDTKAAESDGDTHSAFSVDVVQRGAYSGGHHDIVSHAMEIRRIKSNSN